MHGKRARVKESHVLWTEGHQLRNQFVPQTCHPLALTANLLSLILCFFSFFLFFFFFLCVPSFISGVHHFWWDFCVCDCFFNSTIEVVTYRLRGSKDVWIALHAFGSFITFRNEQLKTSAYSSIDMTVTCTDVLFIDWDDREVHLCAIYRYDCDVYLYAIYWLRWLGRAQMDVYVLIDVTCECGVHWCAIYWLIWLWRALMCYLLIDMTVACTDVLSIDWYDCGVHWCAIYWLIWLWCALVCYLLIDMTVACTDVLSIDWYDCGVHWCAIYWLIWLWCALVCYLLIDMTVACTDVLSIDWYDCGVHWCAVYWLIWLWRALMCYLLINTMWRALVCYLLIDMTVTCNDVLLIDWYDCDVHWCAIYWLIWLWRVMMCCL